MCHQMSYQISAEADAVVRRDAPFGGCISMGTYCWISLYWMRSDRMCSIA